jgi:hypothetical protein
MSRYDVLAKRPTAPQGEVKMGVQKTSARRGNPDYRQFSAYVPHDLYRSLKMRLAEQELELSEAVEDAIRDWLGKSKAS